MLVKEVVQGGQRFNKGTEVPWLASFRAHCLLKHTYALHCNSSYPKHPYTFCGGQQELGHRCEWINRISQSIINSLIFNGGVLPDRAEDHNLSSSSRESYRAIVWVPISETSQTCASYLRVTMTHFIDWVVFWDRVSGSPECFPTRDPPPAFPRRVLGFRHGIFLSFRLLSTSPQATPRRWLRLHLSFRFPLLSLEPTGHKSLWCLGDTSIFGTVSRGLCWKLSISWQRVTV